MANYTIIGGDQKEYGPVTADDVRLWIADGRLNEHSLAKAEGETDFRALGKFPEFAGAFADPAGWEKRDYDLDIGGCIGRGWALFKENMGILFGAFLVYLLLTMIGVYVVQRLSTMLAPDTILTSAVLSQLFNLASIAGISLVKAPFLGGIYYIFIQRMRGRQAEVGDIFIGFKKMFAQLFLGNFVAGFFTGLCLIPFDIAFNAKVGSLAERLEHASAADIQNLLPQFWSAFSSTLPVLFVCMIPVTYLSVNWLFTLPLIIDKQMKFWPAMKASWKKVHRHWWPMLGFVVVIGLLNLAGACACGIGVLFTLPVGVAAMMFAYETIFGESQTR